MKTKTAGCHLTFQRCNYGKNVQPDGTALGEHGHTFQSAGMSPEIVSQCFPHQLGIGMQDYDRWDQYPWPDEGGIAVKPIKTKSGDQLLIGRFLGRSENERMDGARLFTQASYVAIPIAELCDANLAAIPDILKADESDQTEFEFRDDEFELPGNWRDLVRSALPPLVEGRTVGYINHDLSPNDAFREMLVCLACLPAAIRWQIPFGAGLYRVNANQTAIAHGIHAETGVHEVRFDHHAAPQGSGSAYVDWIMNNLGSVETASELHHEVNQLLPSLADRDLDLGESWQESIQCLAEVQHLHTQTQMAVVDQPVRFLKNEVLQHRLASLDTESPDETLLATLVGKAWGEMFIECTKLISPRARAFGGLIGAVKLGWDRIDRLAMIEFRSDELLDRFSKSLSEELRRETKAEHRQALAEVLHQVVDGPGWLNHWWMQDRANIVWKALELELVHEIPCLNEVAPFDPAIDAIRSILGGERPTTEAMNYLLQLFVDNVPQVASDFAEMALAKDMFAESLLMSKRLCELGQRVPSIWGPNSAACFAEMSKAKLKSIASDLAEAVEHYGWKPWLCQYLFALWEFAPADFVAEYSAFAQTRLDNELAFVLLGETNGDGDIHAENYSIVPLAMAVSNDVVTRAMKLLPTHNNTLLLKAVVDWLNNMPDAESKNPVLGFLRDCRLDKCSELPQLSALEALLLTRLLRAFPYRLSIVPPPQSLPQLRAAVAYAQSTDVISFPYVFESALAAAVSMDADNEFWTQRLTELEWEGREYLRLLGSGLPVFDLTHHESTLLSELDDKTFLKYVLSGRPFSETLIGRLNAHTFERVNLTLNDAKCLLKFAKEKGFGSLARQLVYFAVSYCSSTSGFHHSQVIEELRSRGMFSWSWSGIIQNWTEFVLAANEVADIKKAQLIDLVQNSKTYGYVRFEGMSLTRPVDRD